MPTDHFRAAASRPPIEAAEGEAVGSRASVDGCTDGGLRELRHYAAAIARDVWGRGPERCEAHWAGPDLLVVVFYGGLTPAENSLKAAGLGQEVMRSRENFRRLMEMRLGEAAAQLTGRSVSGSVGASRLDPDVTIAAFLMAPFATHPAPAPGPDSARTLAAARTSEVAQRDALDHVSAAAAVTAQARQVVRRARALHEAGRRLTEPGDEPGDPESDDVRNH
jgi:uncharacterized protein YbcI